MISVHLHGVGDHLAFLGLVLVILGAPWNAYFIGRRIGRDDADDAWRELDDEIAADHKRVRAELRDRIDHCREVGVDFEDVLRSVANEDPDLVTEALDEAGAPR